jgi:hypothetical protein
MASELKAETLRKKLLAAESLPDFLARMTLVWEERQRRLAEAPARASAASRRSFQKRLEADPEGVRARSREAVRRYEATNRKALRARQAQRKERLAAALAVARALRRAEKQAQREADKARKVAARVAKRDQASAVTPTWRAARGDGGHAPHGQRPEGYPMVQREAGELRAVSDLPAVAGHSALTRAWSGQATGASRALEDGCSAASVRPTGRGVGRCTAKRRAECQTSSGMCETGPPPGCLLALD